MSAISNFTNSVKKYYDNAQSALQPMREGKGPLKGTIATHVATSALGVTSLLYATGQISGKLPLLFTAANLGSWFVYGNKMYTRYLPRMNEMALAKFCIGTPKSEENTGAWRTNDGKLSSLSEKYLGKGTAAYWQFYNQGLCEDGILSWSKEIGAKSVLDVCCGEQAPYVRALNKMSLDAHGIDLNLQQSALDSGSASVANVLEAFPKAVDKKFDLVLSLEAGAKLPKGTEKAYIKNLTDHAGKAILCSWPVPGQEGPHQQNCLTNDQVTKVFAECGWQRDFERETLLKGSVDKIDFWFQDTLMVFVPK